MPATFDIREIASELVAAPQGWGVFVHRKTGEVRCLPVEDSAGDFSEEELGAIESPEWLAMPDRLEIHPWAIRQRFAASRQDERECEQLSRALHGSGAFRRFLEVAERLGIRQAWYDYEQAAHEEIVRGTLAAEELI